MRTAVLVWLLIPLLAVSCGPDNTGSGTAPTHLPENPVVNRVPNAVPSPTQPSPAIMLTGRVLDASTGASVPGAIVSINGRYQGVSDRAGQYTVNGSLDYGRNHDFTYTSASGYVSDYRYIHGTSLEIPLRRIKRINAGQSVVLTVHPGDSLCVNNIQDTPGLGMDYLCRTIRVTIPAAGTLTVEARSPDGTLAKIESEVFGEVCCAESLDNPRRLKVSAGTDVVVNVEMPATSAVDQAFTVSTSPTLLNAR